jgi:AraC family transcriptional regulator of adaptative response/methylated-DNA-[protein]-cysteine methyltransferase
VTLAELGKDVGPSHSYLPPTFKETLGITPREYAEELQLGSARFLLKEGQSVRRSTYSSGHNSTAWLYSDSGSKLGMRPGEFKAGGAGIRIQYAAITCSLGWVMVGATNEGKYSVSLGASAGELRRYLIQEFPRAQLVEDEGALSSSLNMVASYLEDDKEVDLSDLPLNIQATSFQYRVWKELREIPYG